MIDIFLTNVRIKFPIHFCPVSCEIYFVINKYILNYFNYILIILSVNCCNILILQVFLPLVDLLPSVFPAHKAKFFFTLAVFLLFAKQITRSFVQK